MLTIKRTTERIPSAQAAEFLGVSNVTMCIWRRKGKGPRYYKFGKRFFYSWKDLDAYIESCATDPSAEAA